MANDSTITTVGDATAINLTATTETPTSGPGHNLLVVNNGGGTIHIGPDDTVDTTNGRLPDGQAFDTRVNGDEQWWAISAAGDIDVDVFWSDM